MTQQPYAPDRVPVPVPAPVREAARRTPGQWVGLVDPAWTGEGPPPDWALIGRWRSDEHGEVVAYRPNPEHRPSPADHGWPPPTDPVDAAIQRAATGYGPQGAVHRALAVAPLYVPVDEAGRPVVSDAAVEGARTVYVFTTPRRAALAAVSAAHVALDAARLLAAVPADHRILVNAGGALAMAVPAEALQAATAATATATATERRAGAAT
ncbi:type VII secretion system-associated protein [Streptomyces sp. WAC06614]|uniref:type VII secretion system-associated protein n=1 Tax=Streptomyces sp. WAC06614 TaxID=2487416 RepID=UPI000F7B63EE|nr:type VII secretion system-associated protein [Streptomyces sp. WAC06614]RSS51087.1 type VII secretion system-associated protein [Streptomyces sp. WAC06614]